jgi:hypothetical protein
MITAIEVAHRLGLKRHARSWRGRCPACDYLGTFSVREGRGGRALLFCASCQDRAALKEAVSRILGYDYQLNETDGANDYAVRQRRAEAALRLWHGSEPLAGTAGERYVISELARDNDPLRGVFRVQSRPL